MEKVIIFSAPSGSGKSTIINYLMQQELNLTPQEFRKHSEAGDFLEYQEVYADRFYGTLKAQVDNQLAAGQNVVCDVDVLGGQNIKKSYGPRALAVFIQPPSIDELRRRLVCRGTDSPEVIADRLKRAAFELSFAPKFDVVITNDDLATAQAEALKVVTDFLRSE